MMPRPGMICLLILICSAAATASARGDAPIVIDRLMSPPDWALLQRELLRANTVACEEFFERYFDDRGFLLCVERWGGNDGPDDAIESLLHWPLLYALGAPRSLMDMSQKGWEGHLRQYTLAKTVDVPMARDGMYYREFPVMCDWLHNSEGLTVFSFLGLAAPDRESFEKRIRRYAGFYLNEEPQAANYDPDHRIIRSLFNGSRGPLLRKATALDWAGDPIEVGGRFDARHGETSYEQMLAHFRDYNDVVGDHPSNLLATGLAVNAWMLTHDPKYRDWVAEYVGAWRERMVANGHVIPSNVGLDGVIGSAAGGRWYGGVYGWGFTVQDPQDGRFDHRHTFQLGIHGFLNAVLLTGDRSLVDPWRQQMEVVNSNQRVVDGRTLYPHSFGDDGWYNYQPHPFTAGAREIFYVTMDPQDRKRVSGNAWFDYLEGKDPGYPDRILRGDLDRIRSQVAGMRADETTPDTRLADDPLRFNPASVQSLTELMTGALHPGNNDLVYHCRLRYFDPVERRSGIPPGVAAMIDQMTDDEVSVTLVNTSQLDDRTVIIQAGAYAEHQFRSVNVDDRPIPLHAPQATIHLRPGAGNRLTFRMQRYVNPPTLHFPWSR